MVINVNSDHQPMIYDCTDKYFDYPNCFQQLLVSALVQAIVWFTTQTQRNKNFQILWVSRTYAFTFISLSFVVDDWIFFLPLFQLNFGLEEFPNPLRIHMYVMSSNVHSEQESFPISESLCVLLKSCAQLKKYKLGVGNKWICRAPKSNERI